jgi:DNA-directed RNA polymerase specialized sigma subunit
VEKSFEKNQREVVNSPRAFFCRFGSPGWSQGDATEFRCRPPAPDERRLEPADVSELLASVRGMLPAREFAVLWLRFAEGLTLTAIGERMGFSHLYAAQLVARELDLTGKLCDAHSCD